jgi:uncharacterized membrane protein YgdD (TMEM256/DUF423 family)
MKSLFILLGAASAALSVAIGALGAHKLNPLLKANGKLEAFRTASEYQMYHALAMMAVGILILVWPQKNWGAAGWLFLIGSILFSGSIYVLCFQPYKWLGPVTPIGGLLFMAGWIYIAYLATKN